MNEPSQYGDGGAVVYGSDGEPIALLFAGGMGISENECVDADAEN